MAEGKPPQEIIEIGKDTRFGQPGGADPAWATLQGSPKWSIRGAIRRIAAMSQEQLKEFAQDPNLTTAELLAVKKFMIATGADKKYPNVKAMKELEDSVDGKLVETKVEVTTDSYADLVRQAADADKRSNR